jgi:hypothetical protein
LYTIFSVVVFFAFTLFAVMRMMPTSNKMIRPEFILYRLINIFFTGVPYRMISIIALLVAYVLSRLSLKEASPDTFNDALQALVIGAFLYMAWYMYSAGSWPNLLPFALVQAAVYLVFLISKYLGGRSLVRRLDGSVTTLATLAFTVVALLLILPKIRGRSIEVAFIVCGVLPIIYSLPTQITRIARPRDDIDVIRRAAIASKLVYARSTSSMFDEVEFVHNRETGARCGVYVDKDIQSKTIYIAFSGSDSKVDWIRTNFNVDTEMYGRGKVHKGFMNAWKSIQSQVWTKVSNVMLRQGGSGKVVVCGHSLGGAMATLASMDLFDASEKKYQDSMRVITFASPKVGDVSFRDMFNARIPVSVRVVNVYDPIPNMNINDFVHVKGEVSFVGLGSPHSTATHIDAVQKMGA